MVLSLNPTICGKHSANMTSFFKQVYYNRFSKLVSPLQQKRLLGTCRISFFDHDPLNPSPHPLPVLPLRCALWRAKIRSSILSYQSQTKCRLLIGLLSRTTSNNERLVAILKTLITSCQRCQSSLSWTNLALRNSGLDCLTKEFKKI